VFPRTLREAWHAVELTVPDDGGEPRRAWRARDPESDLEITIVWTHAPDDSDDDEPTDAEGEAPEVEVELEASAPEPPASEPPAEPERPMSEGEEPPTFDLGLPPRYELPGGAFDGEPAAGAEPETPREPGGLLFGHRPRAAARPEDLLRVFELGLRLAERLGKRILDPVLGETFEVEDWAYRITEPFRARSFLATHWVRSEAPGSEDWIHTHGMERFGLPDLETFFKPDENEAGDVVVAYMLELAESWVREDAPAATARPRRLEGVKVRIVEPRAARAKQTTWTEDDLADHDGPRLAVLPAADSWGAALEAWRPANVQMRAPGLVDRLCALTLEILPLVRERFAGGADVKLKARFPVSGGETSHEDPEDATYESMWIHVESWEDDRIRGRLANQPERRRDLACGSAVEIAPSEVWDVLVVKDGRPYRGVSLRRWLRDNT
jgi:hypothetical protein